MSHTFAKKKVWTKSFRVGRSDMDVHTYKSMQNLKYGDGRDLFSMVLKGFLYILTKWLFVGPSAVVQTKQSFLKTAE